MGEKEHRSEMEKRIDELEKALGVYADRDNWHSNGIFKLRSPTVEIQPDWGERARAALASAPAVRGDEG